MKSAGVVGCWLNVLVYSLFILSKNLFLETFPQPFSSSFITLLEKRRKEKTLLILLPFFFFIRIPPFLNKKRRIIFYCNPNPIPPRQRKKKIRFYFHLKRRSRFLRKQNVFLFFWKRTKNKSAKKPKLLWQKNKTTFFSSWLFLSLSSFFPSLIWSERLHTVQVLFDSSRSPSQDMTHTHYQTQTTHTIVSYWLTEMGGNFSKGLKRNGKEKNFIDILQHPLPLVLTMPNCFEKNNKNLYYTIQWFSPLVFSFFS